MKENTFYFSHDYHARKDPKCIALIKDFGIAGYGMYWCLIEILYEQEGKIKKFPALYSALAHELGLKESVFTKQIEAMLHDYQLLVQDENYLWSEAVMRRLEIREEKRQTRAKSGHEGGVKSGESRRYKKLLKQKEATLQTNEANEAKERKGKENKGKDRERGAPTIKSFKKWVDQDFIDDLKIVQNGHPKELLNAFYKYWSEKNPSGKMKLQLEDTWETKKRLETWSRNEEKFSK